MSNTIRLSLNDLLPDTIEGLGDQFKKVIDEKHGAKTWLLLESQALDGLRGALTKIDLFEELGKAWVTIKEIRAYQDPAHLPAGMTDIVALGEHTLTLGAEPELRATIGGWTSPPFKVGYAAQLAFQTVQLSISGCAIVAVATGDCDVTATLSVEGIPVHSPWEITKFKLPGEWRFSPAIKIP